MSAETLFLAGRGRLIVEEFAVGGQGEKVAGVFGEDEAVGSGGFEVLGDGRDNQDVGGFGERIGGGIFEIGAEGSVARSLSRSLIWPRVLVL